VHAVDAILETLHVQQARGRADHPAKHFARLVVALVG
jgi:hypothetical protein